MSNRTALQEAVESLHRCKATFVETISVIEEYQGERVWEGDVHVFALDGHPSAKNAYAWSVPVPGSERVRFYAVLHEGPVDSPEKAVRAALVQEHRRLEDFKNSDHVTDDHGSDRGD